MFLARNEIFFSILYNENSINESQKSGEGDLIRTINSLDELALPIMFKKFIESYLNNISKFDCVEKIILFGSCAKGIANENSDVDLFIITTDEISEDLEYQIIFDNVPNLSDGYVKNDIILKSRQIYNQYKNHTGMLQKAAEREGVDLSGLLPISK